MPMTSSKAPASHPNTRAHSRFVHRNAQQSIRSPHFKIAFRVGSAMDLSYLTFSTESTEDGSNHRNFAFECALAAFSCIKGKANWTASPVQSTCFSPPIARSIYVRVCGDYAVPTIRHKSFIFKFCRVLDSSDGEEAQHEQRRFSLEADLNASAEHVCAVCILSLASQT